MVRFGPLDLEMSVIGRRLAEFQTLLKSCTLAIDLYRFAS
jgi:hypothetical protein